MCFTLQTPANKMVPLKKYAHTHKVSLQNRNMQGKRTPVGIAARAQRRVIQRLLERVAGVVDHGAANQHAEAPGDGALRLTREKRHPTNAEKWRGKLRFAKGNRQVRKDA